MRILYSHRIQSRDGQSVHLEGLVTAFRKAGHQVDIVGPRFYRRAGFGGESRSVRLIRRILPNALAECAEILYNVPAFSGLRRAYMRISPDFVYERYNLYYLAGMLLKRRYRVPYYLEINAPLADERTRFGGLGLPRLARALERLVWRSADRIFVVTTILAEIVAAAGVARERIIVMPNGVDRDAFPAEAYRARPGDPVTIGFLGFVRDWHGVEPVITGLAAQTDTLSVRVIVAGDGPARPELERQAEALGVASRVEFTGLRSREAARDLIRRFDIALQPRAVAYASPLKIFEYMACGRAIVAPDQQNIREILSDGETALLFDPDSPEAMWSAIRRLVADPRMREELGRAARASLDAHDYSWQGNAARIAAAVAADVAQHAAATSAGAAAIAERR
jgi:glycosyltransferase involved in cell wall biosynthesis